MDGYTLKLDKQMSEPETVAATYSDGIFTSAGKSAGYILSDDSISYVARTTKEIKFSGVSDDATASNFYFSGKTMTSDKATVKTDGSPIKILTSGYTLKLGRGMTPSSTKEAWTLNGTTVTYKQTTTAGYSLENNSIVYSKASQKTLATVNGVTSADGLSVSGKTIKLASDAPASKVTVSGDYNFDFADDYSDGTITGSGSDDTIKFSGTGCQLSGGAGAFCSQFERREHHQRL